MTVDIKEIDEATVINACGLLEEHGFEYDVDFTTIYGARWAIVGLRITNARAASLVVPTLS